MHTFMMLTTVGSARSHSRSTRNNKSISSRRSKTLLVVLVLGSGNGSVASQTGRHSGKRGDRGNIAPMPMAVVRTMRLAVLVVSSNSSGYGTVSST